MRGYFWNFDRVTPFPVPALLKNLPEDGTQMIAPEDPAGENAEVRAALATGNLSLEALPAPTTNNTSEASESPLEATIDVDINSINVDVVDGAQGGSPTGSALHTEAVVPPHTIQRTRDRSMFVHQDFHANDSFMSCRSSLEYAGSVGSAGRASTSWGVETRDSWAVPAAESQQPGSPINPILANPGTPSGIFRGVFTGMSGDSGSISLPCPP